MNRHYFNSWKLGIIVFAISLVGIWSCQKEGPFSPVPDSTEKLTRTTDQLKFIQSKSQAFNKYFVIDQFVSAEEGGIIETGNNLAGFSTLAFGPGDLPQDTMITFGWDSYGYVTDLEPHGIVFNNPVSIKLSYKDADLSNVVEDSLRIWYYNEVEDLWEFVGGSVNKTEKQVEGYVHHFSRYALADDDE